MSGLRHLQNSTRSVPRVMNRWRSNIFRPLWCSLKQLCNSGLRWCCIHWLEQITKRGWRIPAKLVHYHSPCSISSLLHIWHWMLACRSQEDAICTLLFFQPICCLDFLLLDHDLYYVKLSPNGQLVILQSLTWGRPPQLQRFTNFEKNR